MNSTRNPLVPLPGRVARSEGVRGESTDSQVASVFRIIEKRARKAEWRQDLFQFQPQHLVELV